MVNGDKIIRARGLGDKRLILLSKCGFLGISFGKATVTFKSAKFKGLSI